MAQHDLNALSAFLAVAEERSFTKAAKRLGVLNPRSATRLEDSKKS